MLKQALTIIVVAWLAVLPASAMHFEGSGTKVDLVPNSGSSVDLNPAGPNHLQDIKGYLSGSPYTNGSMTVEVGLVTLTGTGGAIIGPTTLVEGAVILTITRESDAPGSAIKISWALNPLYTSGTEIVDIFYATGDGTGQYPASFTNKVVDSNMVISIPGVSATTGKAFLWANQVAAGNAELYFKGCIHGAAAMTGPTGLSGNVAVGKLNVGLQGETANPGKNLISVPFYAQSPLIKDMYGDGTDSPWAEGDLIQYKFAASPAYLSAIYVGNTWKDAANTANVPQFEANHCFGNWIITKANKQITLIGKVINIPVPVAIYSGAGLSTGGKTMLGMVYPVSAGLLGTSLLLDGGQNGDLMQYKVSPLGQAYISAVVVSGAWKNASNTSEPLDANIATLRLPNSYLYVRYGDTGFTWNRVVP